MPKYGKVAIVGVGLMGGSVGMALREHTLAKSIVGIGHRQSSLEKALACGAIDEGATDLERSVADAEVVVIATPVSMIAEFAARTIAAAPSVRLITDVGSTKALVCEQLSALVGEQATRFVGSHPLAGDHRTGPEHARSDLFEGRAVVVTPTEQTPQSVVEVAYEFWEALGGKVLTMPPERHDQVLAATSHLPHLVASALAANTPTDCLPLTATGWADTTRVASGDPELWTEIFSQNAPAVLRELERLIELLSQCHTSIADGDWPQIHATLQEAKKIRDALGN